MEREAQRLVQSAVRLRAMREKVRQRALRWVDLRADFVGETKEGNRHLSSRPMLNRIYKISKLRTIVLWRHVLRGEATQSNRLTKDVKSPRCHREG